MLAEVDEDKRGAPGPPGLLHSPIGRSLWKRAPAVRLYYWAETDALVAELRDVPMAAAVEDSHLRVEFGDDDLPTTLCLTGVLQLPDSAGSLLARQVLGEFIWRRLPEVVESGYLDLRLPPAEAGDRAAAWSGLLDEMRPRWRGFERGPRFAVGVELFGAKLRAAVVDRTGTIRADGDRTLTGTTPVEVTDEIALLVAELVEKVPGAFAAPVGVQFGGPVTDGGVLQHFDKLGGDVWRDVDVRDLLVRSTGRRTTVVNDAEALAELEIAQGTGGTRVGVVIVGQGIGGRLIDEGRPMSYPMEIGVLVPNPWTGEETHRHPGAIEATASIPAIVAAVQEIDSGVQTMADVAQVAAGRGYAAVKVREILTEAGRRLAHGLGHVQAILNPRVWVVYAPRELMDESRRAARAYFDGLRSVNAYIGFDSMWNPSIEPKAMFGSEGARAAAAAALAAIGRSHGPTGRVSPSGER